MVESICIVHGGDISIPCGGSNRVIAFATTLRDAGFKVDLVVPKPKRNIPNVLENISIHSVPIEENVKNQLLRAVFLSLKAKKIANRSKAMLQIEHTPLAGVASLVGCTGYVADMHDLIFASPIYSKLLFSKIIRKLIYNIEMVGVQHAIRVIVVSNPMKKFIMEKWKVPDESIEVIPNGYFESKFNILYDLNSESKLKNSRIISFIGTLLPKLDTKKIIKLAEHFYDYKLYIIGDGPIRKQLELEIKNRNLDNVVIAGRLSDEEAWKMLLRSRVVVLPEKPSLLTEMSCPVKLFDYAALRRAIVADNVAEMCKIFKECRAALVSDPDDIDKFISNVSTLLENENIRLKVSTNAQKIVKKFTWEKQARKLIKLYEDLTWEEVKF